MRQTRQGSLSATFEHHRGTADERDGRRRRSIRSRKNVFAAGLEPVGFSSVSNDTK